MQAIECEITPLSAAEVERLQAVAVRIDLDFSHALQWLATLPEWERQADLADLETVADACERGELVLRPRLRRDQRKPKRMPLPQHERG